MNEQLKSMLHLQELDQELARLQEDLRRFEPVFEGLKRERARRAAANQKHEKEIHAAAAERRKLEAELKDSEARLSRFRQQQEQVRTAKEAEALEHEAQGAQSSIDSLEERILALIDKEDALASSGTLKLRQEKQLETKATAEQTRLETLRKQKAELSKALQGDRIAAANRLGEDLLETYEWLRKRHGPTAVAGTDKGACAGCGNVLVAQLAIKAKSGDELLQCPNCQRFLR
ncbi:MAG: zinc ribbon domain-containing protein [Candidatus Sumerlaeaceae bacterium]